VTSHPTQGYSGSTWCNRRVYIQFGSSGHSHTTALVVRLCLMPSSPARKEDGMTALSLYNRSGIARRRTGESTGWEQASSVQAYVSNNDIRMRVRALTAGVTSWRSRRSSGLLEYVTGSRFAATSLNLTRGGIVEVSGVSNGLSPRVLRRVDASSREVGRGPSGRGRRTGRRQVPQVITALPNPRRGPRCKPSREGWPRPARPVHLSSHQRSCLNTGWIEPLITSAEDRRLDSGDPLLLFRQTESVAKEQ
jgi:hypothetical protein